MGKFILLLGLCGIAACSAQAPGDRALAAARERYAELVRSTEGSATSSESAQAAPHTLVDVHSSLDTLSRYESPCVLVFVGPHCAPCVTAVRDFVPRLTARGWRVYVLDERTEQPVFAACGVDAKPTFVCLRRGVECGRSIGADWNALCAMLRVANERWFSDLSSATTARTAE